MLRLGALAAVAAACAAAPVVLNFQVEPQQEVCFFEDIQAGMEYDASVLVYRGGKLDIKLRVEGPDRLAKYEQLVFSNIDDGTGAMLNTIVRKGPKLVADQTGTFTFCVDNRMARWTAKVVTFELSVSDPKQGSSAGGVVAPLKDGATEAETAAHTIAVLKSGSARLHSKLMLIENSQYYHYHRERRHRDTAESTNGRVKWWGIVEGLVVLVLTAGQVILIHTWVGSGSKRISLPRGASGV